MRMAHHNCLALEVNGVCVSSIYRNAVANGSWGQFCPVSVQWNQMIAWRQLISVFKVLWVEKASLVFTAIFVVT